MKKIFLLAAFLLCTTLFLTNNANAAETTTYENVQYKFSVAIPSDFENHPIDAPNWLKAFTNKKIYIQIGYINPFDNYSADNFGLVPQTELDGFIKRQRLVSALTTSNFAMETWGKNETALKYPYVWAMFSATTQLEDITLKTFNYKNFYLYKDRIIEIDFIIPEIYLHESTKLIDKITQSFQFAEVTPN